MTVTVSAEEFGPGAASRALDAAQEAPVLVCRQGQAAAWLVSSERLAQVVAVRDGEPGDIYQRTLELLAVELFRTGVLSLGQASTLAGLSLSDFIDLCGRLHVPILWETDDGATSDADALALLLSDAPSGG